MLNKTATIVLSQVTNDDLPLIQGDVIAVDKGCELLLKKNKKITQAIGDFDSIQRKFLKKLQEDKVPLATFPTNKDQSDAELALNWVIKKGYAIVRMIGFQGGRLDHYQAIIQMLFRFQHAGVTLLTPHQSIQYLQKGIYNLKNQKSEKYFSIFTLSHADISIQHARYPLVKKELTVKDTFTLSNEWIENQDVILTIRAGEVLLYRSILT